MIETAQDAIVSIDEEGIVKIWNLSAKKIFGYSRDEIMGKARFGRDYLQLFQLQCGQGLDQRTVVENVLSLIVEKFMGKIGQEIIGESRFPDARSIREFGLSVRDEMIDGMLALENQIVNHPDEHVRMPSRTETQKEQHQSELLNMSIGVQEGSHP